MGYALQAVWEPASCGRLGRAAEGAPMLPSRLERAVDARWLPATDASVSLRRAQGKWKGAMGGRLEVQPRQSARKKKNGRECVAASGSVRARAAKC
jgi:hypothetical protein